MEPYIAVVSTINTGENLLPKEKKSRLDICISGINFPYIELREQNLSYSFTNWSGQTVSVLFDSVFSFRWCETLNDPTIEDDAAFVISRSSWRAMLAEEHGIQTAELKHLRHFRFCVQDGGTLDVLCESFEANVTGEESPLDPGLF